MPNSCIGMNRSIAITSAVVNSTLNIDVNVEASHFPPAIAWRGAGFTNSGSSDPRSRSPAVESIAICMPPAKAASTMNIGMKLKNHRRALLRARHLDVLDLQRRCDGRADAAIDQPQRADFAAVTLKQATGALDFRLRGLP